MFYNGLWNGLWTCLTVSEKYKANLKSFSQGPLCPLGSHEIPPRLSMLSELAYESNLRVFAFWWSLNSSFWHHGCSHARIHARLHARTCIRVHAWTHPRKCAHTLTSERMCVYRPENNVFARSGVCKKECPEKTETLPFGRPPPSRQSWQHSLRAFQAERKKVPRMHPLPRIGLCQLCLWMGRGWATPFLPFLRGYFSLQTLE